MMRKLHDVDVEVDGAMPRERLEPCRRLGLDVAAEEEPHRAIGSSARIARRAAEVDADDQGEIVVAARPESAPRPEHVPSGRADLHDVAFLDRLDRRAQAAQAIEQLAHGGHGPLGG